MTTSRRLILIDVDGTLVTYSNELPESAAQAVRRARQDGHIVVPTTGRSKGEMPDYVWSVGFDGMIGGNGAYVELDGDVVMHDHLSRQQCEAVVSWLTERGLEFYLEANSGLYPSPGFREAALPAIRAYIAGKGRTDAESMTVEEVFPDFIDGAELIREDVNKISYVLSGGENSAEDLAQARADFPELEHGSWGGRGHEVLFGDMGVAGVSKKRAIEVLLDRLDLGYQDAVAVGDGLVDLEMIRDCGVGVAMGNAHPDVKEAADLVTEDVDHDGLAKAFDALGLTAGSDE